MHKLLQRQLLRCFGSLDRVPPEIQPLLALVDAAYAGADSDRALLEHSMETVSGELVERFNRIQQQETKYRQLSEQREHTLSLLYATLESTADGILVVDRQGRTTSYNRTFARMWGIPATLLEAGDDTAMLEFVLDQLVDPQAFLQRVRELYDRPDAEGEDVVHFKDGRVFERSSKPQLVGSEVVGRVWSFRDVTRQRQTEAQLIESQKLEAVGRLAGGIAHDFNNMLTAIQGFANLLEAELAGDDHRRGHVAEIRMAATRSAALTQQLLAFSRRQFMEPAVVDLNAVVTELGGMLDQLIGPERVLRLGLDTELPPVFADAGQLGQVLLNLVVNARDAMPHGGTITIETLNRDLAAADAKLAAGRYAVLRVADTGCGIEPSVLPHLFEPFFTTKEPGRGTGLGLSTVYGIVKQSGGEVVVESQPGSGTTFMVYLPALDGAPASPEPAERRGPAAGGRGTVLLSEDERAVRRLVRRILERAGYTVLEASDGTEALRIAGEHDGAIDLLITDVVMPRLNGRELAARLRATRPELRVIFMSAYSEEALAHHERALRGARFVPKPFSTDALVALVHETIGNGEQAEALGA